MTSANEMQREKKRKRKGGLIRVVFASSAFIDYSCLFAHEANKMFIKICKCEFYIHKKNRGNTIVIYSCQRVKRRMRSDKLMESYSNRACLAG